ncbi:MAG: hypothetical protein H7Y42_19195 [Chitinophagaceae bacterium]|nr:hypothetical protein [Chitinophagaceae bacterium]
MSDLPRKRYPWRRRLLIAVLILAVIFAGIYWYIATEKFADTKDRKAAYTVSAIEFMREFEENDSAANAKYADRIVTVNGRVSAIEAPDTTLNVKFINPATGSYVIFDFQQQHQAEARTVKVGDSISIKGSCSGGIFSEILETTAITFKRSTLNK